MARYKFPLQKLLDIRIDKEDESKREFMEAQRLKMQEEQRLVGLQQDYGHHNILDREEDLAMRRVRENYLSYLRKSIEESKQELIEREEFQEQKRLELTQRQIERKTVEKLKEKRVEAFNTEQDDLERKANDEFALYSYIRNLERR